MKILGMSLVVASLLLLAACSGGQDAPASSTAGTAAEGSGAETAPGPASAANLAPAPADGTTIMLDVSGMT